MKKLIVDSQEFIDKYSSIEVPYTKTGDHLYLVVAKLNDYPLITRDKGLRARANEAGIKVYTPTEFIEKGNGA